MMTDRKALGRGLAALIPQKINDKTDLRENVFLQGKEVIFIPVDAVRPNRFQPRKDFKGEKLNDLVESIRQKGILQPVLARHLGGDSFELLAGERRWRAAKILGLAEIPAIIKEAAGSDALEIALIENLQRDDLNPIEEARAYKKFIDEFGLDCERIAQIAGRAQSSVSNMLRLLSLPQKVQEAILAGLISAGHAKAILALKEPAARERLCRRIIKNGLSVRDAERISSGNKVLSSLNTPPKKDAGIVDMQESLQKALGTKVRILAGKRGGKLVVEYFSNSDLERISNIIMSSIKTSLNQ